MEILATLENGVWLYMSNGVEFQINKTLMKLLHKKGVKVRYKYRKEKSNDRD